MEGDFGKCDAKVMENDSFAINVNLKRYCQPEPVNVSLSLSKACPKLVEGGFIRNRLPPLFIALRQAQGDKKRRQEQLLHKFEEHNGG